jgi:RNA polymerase sigma-70 factor (ECF subfamily)
MTVVLDELAECVVAEDTVEEAIDRQALIGAINAFLRALPDEKRRIFLCRYWYALPVSQIAARFGRTENYISVTLSRLRGKLREYLIKGGFDV